MTCLKLLAAAAVVATASLVLPGAASAAPIAPAFSKASIPAQSGIESVYWVRRHGHRMWVRPHHHR